MVSALDPRKASITCFLIGGCLLGNWKARNDACFNAKLIHHPAEIICRACAFLFFWAGLHKDAVHDQIKGVGMLLSLACQMLASQNRALARMFLPPPHQDPSDAANDDEDI